MTTEAERIILAFDARAAEVGAKVFEKSTSLVARGARSAVNAINPLHFTLNKLGTALSAGAIFYGLNKTVKEFATLEKQMASVSTMLDDQSMKYLPSYEKSIRSMSKSFGEGTDTLSKGLYDILSASVSADKALSVLETSAKAAKAGMTSTGIAADAITTVINSYRMSADDAAKVSDIMFATVKRGKTTFSELAPQIGQVASIAATAGLSFEELSAAIATMTRAGVKTDIAITSLKSIITSFLDPQEEAAKLARQYGFELNAATLKAEGLTGVLNKLKGMEKDHLAILMPNVRGLTGFAASLQNTEAQADDLNFMLHSSGRTLEAYNKMVSISDHAFERLGQTFVDTKRIIGKAFAPEWVRSAEQFNKTLDKNSDKISYWAKISAAELTRIKDYMVSFGTYLKDDFSEAANAGMQLFLASIETASKIAIDLAIRTGEGIWKGLKEGLTRRFKEEDLRKEAMRRYIVRGGDYENVPPRIDEGPGGLSTRIIPAYDKPKDEALLKQIYDEVKAEERAKMVESVYAGTGDTLKQYLTEFKQVKEGIISSVGGGLSEGLTEADTKAGAAHARAKMELQSKQYIEQLKPYVEKAKQFWQYIKAPWTNKETSIATSERAAVESEVVTRKIRSPQVQQYFDDLNFELSIIGKTNDARERAIEMRKLESAAMEAYAGNQARVNEELDAYRAKLDELEKARDLKWIADEMGQSFTNAFDKIIQGTESVSAAFRQMGYEIVRATMQKMVFDPMSSALSAGIQAAMMSFTGGASLAGNQAAISQAGGLSSVANSPQISAFMMNALGNVFSRGSVMAFADGGIVNRPTLFPMRNGTGLMGEAGPEAIMPLKRGRDGKLGVTVESSPQPAPIVNVPQPKVIIVDDPKKVYDHMSSYDGEKIFFDFVKRNSSAIGMILGG